MLVHEDFDFEAGNLTDAGQASRSGSPNGAHLINNQETVIYVTEGVNDKFKATLYKNNTIGTLYNDSGQSINGKEYTIHPGLYAGAEDLYRAIFDGSSPINKDINDTLSDGGVSFLSWDGIIPFNFSRTIAPKSNPF